MRDLLIERLGLEPSVVHEEHGQWIISVSSAQWMQIAQKLRDDPVLAFEILIDIAGIDYSTYKNVGAPGARFAAVYQLLSIVHNLRLRVKVFAENDAWPAIPSIITIWSAANWFEREAYDLYGILFEGHPDLRRLLTDYGFVGHPFRKDFPLTGHVEMRYDPEQKRVIYQPVTIEPREIIPRVVREDHYARSV
ncbi:MAG: NADH-quinone oxidoreductase subunit C [Pseudomonadota bacterium]